MKNFITTSLLTLTVLISGVIQVNAGTLYPTTAPGETMYSIQDIYNLVNASTTTSIGNGSTIYVPSSVSNTMVSLTDLYNAILARFGNNVNPPVEPPVVPGEDDLDLESSNDNPDPSILFLDQSDSTEHEIFAFVLDASNSDNNISINEISINLVISTGTVEDVINDFYLVINGDELGDWSITSTTSTSTTITFDIDGDYTINAGDSVNVDLYAEFDEMPEDSVYQDSKIKASVDLNQISAEGVDDVVVEGSPQEGNEHTLISRGFYIDNVETRTIESSNEISGQFVISFDLTSVDEDYYIDDSASSTRSTGILYHIEGDGEFSDVARVDSTGDFNSGVYHIGDGETQTLTLEVDITSTMNGMFRLVIDEIFYAEDSNSAQDSNLVESQSINSSDFRTDYIHLQGSN